LNLLLFGGGFSAFFIIGIEWVTAGHAYKVRACAYSFLYIGVR
jgi:hypothetical protein